MNAFWAAVFGTAVALLSLSFGATGNLVIIFISYGSAIFLLESTKGIGVWYLASAAIIADLLGTSRFGEHLILAALTYMAQYVLVQRLRFTAPANRQALAITVVCLSATALSAQTFSLHVCLLTVGSLIILLSINYILSNNSSPLRYADS